MKSANSLLALLTALVVVINSTQRTNADLVVTQDLGVLAMGSSTAFDGNTATGANNCDTYTAAGGIDTWGNEIVFQFTVTQKACIGITSVALGGDPDVFLLNGLGTEVNAAGLLDATGALAFALLDGTVPQSENLAIVEPGTYYLSVDSYGEADAVFFYNLTINDVILPVASSIGTIAEAETPFTIDTIGNTIDTEIAVYDANGKLLALNDDADLTGDGFTDVYQSRMDFFGLPAGSYYLAIGAWDTLWNNCFGADGSDGTEGGLLNINHGATPALILEGQEPVPAANSIQGTLVTGGILWYTFEIGKAIPPEPVAPLRITNITRNADGYMIITFNSAEGREYAVDISANMSEWQELTDGLIGNAKTTIYTHTSPDLSSRTLFYRIRDLEAGGEEGPSLNDGLIAHYLFNGSFDDISGNGYHLTEENPGNTQFNEENSAASFDASQYGLHYQTTGNVIPDGAQTMSCSFRFSGEQNQWGGSQMIMAMGQHGSSWFQVHLQPTDDDWLFRSFEDVPITPGVWYHMACVRDQQLGLDLTYLNGEKVGEKPIDNNNVTSPLISIGVLKGATLNDWTRQPFIGSIDNARIYNRALSSNEIVKLYGLEKPALE